MKYYLFIDETGDHSLSNVDTNFPIFMIGGILISEKEYRKFQEQINLFKKEFFGDKNVILHSRDIRKINPPFQILFDLGVKKKFYNKLDRIIKETNFVINPVAIMKAKHIKKYGRVADNPYNIALNLLIERTIFDSDEMSDCSEISVIIEKRGKKEDEELLRVYQRIISRGTGYVTSERVSRLLTSIDFKNKLENDEGLQLSDLVSYPIARKMLYPSIINPAFDIIENKIRKQGWKIFP